MTTTTLPETGKFKWNTRTKRILLGVFALLVICSIDATAKKVKFSNSSVVPAARGTAKITRDKNRNYIVKIQLTGLAEVQRLDPAKLYYIVWMEGDGISVQNLGKIDSSTGFLSKLLKASFETSTAVKPTQIFITAEDDATTQYPGRVTIISTPKF